MNSRKDGSDFSIHVSWPILETSKRKHVHSLVSTRIVVSASNPLPQYYNLAPFVAVSKWYVKQSYKQHGVEKKKWTHSGKRGWKCWAYCFWEDTDSQEYVGWHILQYTGIQVTTNRTSRLIEISAKRLIPNIDSRTSQHTWQDVI